MREIRVKNYANVCIGEYPFHKQLKDELVPLEFIKDLDNKLSAQKGIKVEFETINEANHFFSKNETELVKCLNKYIKKETALY